MPTLSDAEAVTVTGTFTVTASASDNVGIAGVQFLLDGANLGPEVTGVGPTYAYDWTTTTALNGPHTLSARARDGAGNAASAANVPVTVSNTSGLVAAYSFSEGSGTSVTDSSSNNLTGIIVGATWTTGGRYGNALSFNGTSSYVDLGNPTALQLTGSMTLEAWVNAAANPADDGQIVAKSNGSAGWQFKTSPDTGPHTFGLAVSGNSSSVTQRYSTTVRSLNTWYHVAGVYNATTGTMDIYVNGTLNDGILSGAIPNVQFNQNVNVNIGRRTGGYYFNGIIDELRIYNRALSQAEIQTDMNTPIGGTPPPPDTTPPTAPSGLSATGTSSTQISLNWVASTDNIGVTGYRVERCQGAGCSSFAQVGTVSSGTIYTDSGLTVLTSYSYRVRANDAAGNLSTYSGVATATTPDSNAPTAPNSLTATAASTSQINLSWNASTDNVGVTAYLIERCQGSGCANFTQIASGSSGTIYSDTGLAASTPYSYRLRATDAAGNLSNYSNIVSATTLGVPDTQPPTAPSNLVATAASGTQINLSWAASTDNVGVTRYLVERCQGAGCSNFAQVGTPTTTTFNDTALLAATTYSYRVRATDAANNVSSYSNVAGATTSAAAQPPIAFVQQNSAVPQTPQITVPVAYRLGQIAGDLNVVVVGWNDSTASVSSVKDTSGNAYIPAIGPTVQTGVATQTIYYAKNISTASAGANTVTVTFTIAATYPDIRIAEYSGLDTVNPLDVAVGAQGSGTSSNSGTITTTNANDLLIGANLVQTGTSGAGTGYTNRVITSPDGDILEDRVVTTIGSYAATAPISPSAQWIMQLVAFKRHP